MSKLKLSWQPYNLELKHTFSISNYSRTTTPVVLVKLKYDNYIGYGEASLPQYLGETQESVMDFLDKIDLTAFTDPTLIDDILDYTESIATGNTAAKASFDIALHDLVGKIKGKSWHSIWNLDKNNTPYTSYTIGIDSDEMVRKKTEEIRDLFKIIKVKLGGENDKKMIEAIRSVSDSPLFVDANQGWKDRQEALDMIYWLKQKGCVLIEQPMSKTDLESNAWLTQNSPLPVFADESFQRFTDLERIKGAFSGVNIKLMKCTGMREAKKILDFAPSFGFKTMIGCMTETSCAISAAAQLSPLVDYADLDGNILIKNDCFEGVKIIDGKITLNDLPGIGITPK
ncbi:MAG: dipeptide epimerase [Dysgonomonas sp.]